jgi:adenylosuccinate synthase
MGKLQVIVGGQYGSEAKGAVTGYLARSERNLLAIRVGGPNAGHTVYDENGTRWPLRQVPVAAVTNPNAHLVVGPGSEVDLPVLREEVAGLGVGSRLWIDAQATLMSAADKIAGEAQLNRGIGSTGKGVSTSRANRIMRKATLAHEIFPLSALTDTALVARRHLEMGHTVQVEGTQGYALGLHAGWYPHCTSGDCRAIDMLSQAGVTPWDEFVDDLEVWVVFRTYPIRVAGPSGPMYGETSWGELGLAPEYTTVTQKMRRVGDWDFDLARKAIDANGGANRVHVALMMFDYWYPEIEGMTDIEALDVVQWERLWSIAGEIGADVELIGTGPRTLIDLRKS